MRLICGNGEVDYGLFTLEKNLFLLQGHWSNHGNLMAAAPLSSDPGNRKGRGEKGWKMWKSAGSMYCRLEKESKKTAHCLFKVAHSVFVPMVALGSC